MSQDAAETDRPLAVRMFEFPLIALLLAVSLYVLAYALGLSLAAVVPPLGQPTTAAVQGAIVLGMALGTYKLAIVHLGEQPHDDLPAHRALPDLGKGIVAGALLFSLVAGIAAMLGTYRVTGPAGVPSLLLPLISTAIVPVVMEELLFRGILFRWIEEFGGSWAALAITALLFGLVHIKNPNATWFSSLAIALEAGLLLGGAYMLTRSLWMPIGLHAAWNFTQGSIFGVPVSGIAAHGILKAKLVGPVLLSGGSFGLEASVIALAICIAAGTWLIVLAVRRGQVVRPWWARRRVALNGPPMS
jgi:membrane protease YdiL (CAAX protease family)